MAANSTKPAKPKKPYPDFPLFPHATKRWAKKIRGKFHYFGPWADPQAALDRYLEQRDDLHAGRTPHPKAGDGITIKYVCNKFLTFKKNRLASGELSERSFRDYLSTCERLADVFGKAQLADDLASSDFERLRGQIAETRGAVALGNEITRVRTIFKYALKENLIERPARYGVSFDKPTDAVLRRSRAQSKAVNGDRMFQANELRTIIAAANPPMEAMVLLAINMGLGQSDLANLPMTTIKTALATGWLDYPRQKTGTERRCPLWPETIQAIREALDSRPTPKSKAEEPLTFLTELGIRWVNPRGNNDLLGKRFTRLLKALELKRPRVSFYALRHGFQTVADGTRDPVAVDAIMGHVDNSMADRYRECIDDERLQAVVDHVRLWLFGDSE